MSHQKRDRTENLEDAFHLFNQVSEKLADSYQVIEQRVAELTTELSAAHGERLKQLAEKESLANRLQSLLAALPGGVVVLDDKGVIQECNPAAIDLLGEPLLGQSWERIAERAFDEVDSEDCARRLRDGRLVSVVTRKLGNEPGSILLIQDVTETRALQERLNRHKRLSAMGEMAAKLAHQIRTPLASAMLLNNGEREIGNNDESAPERLRRLAFNLQIATMRRVNNKALIEVVDGQMLSLPLGFVIELIECLSPATHKDQDAGQLRTNHGMAKLIAMKKSKEAGLSHAALYVDCVLGVQSVSKPPSVASSYRDSLMGIRIMPIDVEQMLHTMFQER